MHYYGFLGLFFFFNKISFLTIIFQKTFTSNILQNAGSAGLWSYHVFYKIRLSLSTNYGKMEIFLIVMHFCQSCCIYTNLRILLL